MISWFDSKVSPSKMAKPSSSREAPEASDLRWCMMHLHDVTCGCIFRRWAWSTLNCQPSCSRLSRRCSSSTVTSSWVAEGRTRPRRLSTSSGKSSGEIFSYFCVVFLLQRLNFDVTTALLTISWFCGLVMALAHGTLDLTVKWLCKNQLIKYVHITVII